MKKLKQSKQVESFWIKKHPNGIYHLLFNTKDRWVYFHQFNETQYQIGGGGENETEEEYKKHIQDIPEGLIPENGSFICTTLQEKDQISFYFIPRSILFRNGETIIYNSKDLKKETPVRVIKCHTCNDSKQVEVRRIGYDSIMGTCPNC